MKFWDISEVDFDNQSTENFFLEKRVFELHGYEFETSNKLEEMIEETLSNRLNDMQLVPLAIAEDERIITKNSNLLIDDA